MTLETCDFWDIWSESLWQSDEETWPDHSFCFLTIFTIWKFRHLRQISIMASCDIWDTDYSSVHLEPVFTTIFVTWQLIVGQHLQFLQCLYPSLDTDTCVFPCVYIYMCLRLCLHLIPLSVKPALRLPRPEMTDRVGCSAGDRGRERKTFLRRNCIWTEILTIIDRSKVLCFAFLVFCYF